MPLLVQELGLHHSPEVLLDDFSTHFDEAQAMPHAHAVLGELRRRGLKIGIVTNGWPEAQTRCLQACRLLPLVDDVVISKSVSLSKPDPRIYQLALERLEVAASEAWFVGDSPRNDIWGPQQVGIRAAFLPTGHALQNETPDAILTDLRGVLHLT